MEKQKTIPRWYQRFNDICKTKSSLYTYKEFCSENESRLKTLYPFLSKEQIKGKLCQQWKRKKCPSLLAKDKFSSITKSAVTKLRKPPVAVFVNDKVGNEQLLCTSRVFSDVSRNKEDCHPDWMKNFNGDIGDSKEKSYNGRWFTFSTKIPDVIHHYQSSEKSILKNERSKNPDGTKDMERMPSKVSFNTSVCQGESPQTLKFPSQTVFSFPKPVQISNKNSSCCPTNMPSLTLKSVLDPPNLLTTHSKSGSDPGTNYITFKPESFLYSPEIGNEINKTVRQHGLFEDDWLDEQFAANSRKKSKASSKYSSGQTKKSNLLTRSESNLALVLKSKKPSKKNDNRGKIIPAENNGTALGKVQEINSSKTKNAKCKSRTKGQKLQSQTNTKFVSHIQQLYSEESSQEKSPRIREQMKSKECHETPLRKQIVNNNNKSVRIREHMKTKACKKAPLKKQTANNKSPRIREQMKTKACHETPLKKQIASNIISPRIREQMKTEACHETPLRKQIAKSNQWLSSRKISPGYIDGRKYNKCAENACQQSLPQIKAILTNYKLAPHQQQSDKMATATSQKAQVLTTYNTVPLKSEKAHKMAKRDVSKIDQKSKKVQGMSTETITSSLGQRSKEIQSTCMYKTGTSTRKRKSKKPQETSSRYASKTEHKSRKVPNISASNKIKHKSNKVQGMSLKDINRTEHMQEISSGDANIAKHISNKIGKCAHDHDETGSKELYTWQTLPEENRLVTKQELIIRNKLSVIEDGLKEHFTNSVTSIAPNKSHSALSIDQSLGSKHNDVEVNLRLQKGKSTTLGVSQETPHILQHKSKITSTNLFKLPLQHTKLKSISSNIGSPKKLHISYKPNIRSTPLKSSHSNKPDLKEWPDRDSSDTITGSIDTTDVLLKIIKQLKGTAVNGMEETGGSDAASKPVSSQVQTYTNIFL